MIAPPSQWPGSPGAQQVPGVGSAEPARALVESVPTYTTATAEPAAPPPPGAVSGIRPHGARAVVEVVPRLGVVQIDSVNVPSSR